MKSDKILLAVLFLLVAGAVFLAVYVLLGDSGGTPASSGRPDDAPQIVPVRPEPSTASGRKPRERDQQPVRSRPTAPLSNKVTGTVVDAVGSPVEGADVRLLREARLAVDRSEADWADIDLVNQLVELPDGEGEALRPMELWAKQLGMEAALAAAAELATATSLTDGTFELLIPAHAADGPFLVVAESDGRTAQIDDVVPGENLLLRIGAAGTVKGTVLTEAGAQPVPGARVVFEGRSRHAVAETGPDGTFTVDGLGPGNYAVSAVAPGLTPLRSRRVAVAPGGEALVLRMPRGTRLEVHCMALEEFDGTEAMPLEGVKVVIVDMVELTYVIATSDVAGVAAFPGLPPGEYTVNGAKEGWAGFSDFPFSITGEDLTQEEILEFEKARETEIVVLDDENRALSGVVFYTSNWQVEYDALLSKRLPGETDTQGRYRAQFEQVGPRECIWGFKDGYAVVQVYPEDYASGETVRARATRAYTLSGVVRTPEGKPVPNAVVGIEVEPSGDAYFDQVMVRLRTDAQGRYSFAHLPAGTLFIEAEGLDDWSESFDVELSGEQRQVTQDLVIGMPSEGMLDDDDDE